MSGISEKKICNLKVVSNLKYYLKERNKNSLVFIFSKTRKLPFFTPIFKVLNTNVSRNLNGDEQFWWAFIQGVSCCGSKISDVTINPKVNINAVRKCISGLYPFTMYSLIHQIKKWNLLLLLFSNTILRFDNFCENDTTEEKIQWSEHL